MKEVAQVLQKIGLSPKETAVYTALIFLGPSPVRKIADQAGINRGTTHEALKSLQRLGLVSYYHQEKRQHFVAEDPNALTNILKRQEEEVKKAGQALKGILPKLQALPSAGKNGPTVKYYEDYAGIRSILEDALDSVEQLPEKEYVAYSAASIRPYLYHKKAFPKFNNERLKRKISVRAIAIGSGGGTYGKDERRWLTKKDTTPTYTLIYAGKVAMISLGPDKIPHGLITEDQGIYQTQLLLFNALWESLEK